MTTLIYGIVFALLLTILVTIGNLIFSIGEITETKDDKKPIVKVIKTAVFVLIKIVLFALIINLIMFSFFGGELDLNNIQTQILTIFISFQIIVESISINKLLRITVKSLNNSKDTINTHIDKVENVSFFSQIVRINKFIWLGSSVLNLLTIIYLIVLMCFDFTFFYQNMFIYFLMLIYIKYLTYNTFGTKLNS